jgi:hypothetical protein
VTVFSLEEHQIPGILYLVPEGKSLFSPIARWPQNFNSIEGEYMKSAIKFLKTRHTVSTHQGASHHPLIAVPDT